MIRMRVYKETGKKIKLDDTTDLRTRMKNLEYKLEPIESNNERAVRVISNAIISNLGVEIPKDPFSEQLSSTSGFLPPDVSRKVSRNGLFYK